MAGVPLWMHTGSLGKAEQEGREGESPRKCVAGIHGALPRDGW